MRHTLLALALNAFLVGFVSAQEEALPSPSIRTKANPKGPSHKLAPPASAANHADTYSIEILVVENRAPVEKYQVAPESPIAAPARAHAGYYKVPRSPDGDVRRVDAARKHDQGQHTVPLTTATSATRSSRAADENDDLVEEVQNNPAVSVLAAPKLAVIAGQSGVIQLQSAQVFTYLEPLGEGKFQAKHTAPTELGMKFVLGVQPVIGDTQAVEVSPLEIELSVLDGREPVEGLDLDVGKPIIATRSLKTTAQMKLGDKRIIPIPSGPTKHAALLLRINRIDSAEHEQRVLPPATNPDPAESSP